MLGKSMGYAWYKFPTQDDMETFYRDCYFDSLECDAHYENNFVLLTECGDGWKYGEYDMATKTWNIIFDRD
jgi:hypothetical protein